MGTRAIRLAAAAGLVTLMLIGCGRQVSRTPDLSDDLLAVGPGQMALASARPAYTLAALEATGGVSAWMDCRRIDLSGVVSAYRPDGSYYMTEHAYMVYPWSEAIRISAQEPRSRFVWRLVGLQFERLEGDPSLDVSPLAGAYQDYAAALLEISTAPVRLMDEQTRLDRRPLPVQIAGRQYDAIDARFGIGEGGTPSGTPAYWTNATYFLNRESSRVDMVWLANPLRRNFLVVRGYDYARAANGVMVPTEIEILRSDAEARLGTRLATIYIAR